MARRTHSRLSAGVFVLLIAAHLDFWRPQREVVWFGWLPEELLWRLAWMVLAAAFVIHFTYFVWAGEDSEEGGGR